MIRVLHYGLSSNRGGIETYLYKIFKNIDKSIFQFDFIDTNIEKPCFYDEFSEMGSKFYKITPRNISLLQNKRDLINLFKSERFDIVHCHLNTLSYIEPVILALKNNSKVILHSRSSKASKSTITNSLHFINFLRMRSKDVKRVAVSELAGNWLFGTGSKFEILNNGIEIMRYKYNEGKRKVIRNQLDLEGKFVIGNIGAFLYPKNHRFLVRVFHRLVQKKSDSVLLLVGSGPLEEEIKSIVYDLGLNDKVLFLGNRPDVPDILSAMDCFFFPSIYEGFPNAVLEAQCSGLNCIISDNITEEVMVEDYCTKLPLNSSLDDWANLILKSTNTIDREKGTNVVEKAGFSVNKEIKRLESIYLEAL